MPPSLHTRVTEDVGRSIVDGTVPAGTVLLSDEIERRQGVSRSVIREAIRVLGSMGLVESVKRVGIRVLPPASWNAYDPTIIRWRLLGPGKGEQLRSLTELRSAVEPMAAELAARHAAASVSADLLDVAELMRTAGDTGDLTQFLELDIRFHRLVLRGSGNEMFAKLDGAVAAVLSGRTDLGLMPDHPHENTLQLHAEVAEAISGAQPQKAREAMELIMRRTYAEVQPTWAGGSASAL
ncbi:FadR family transcriptional regulator [Cryobacterium adonitolivorans]|uniref:FadR family transcriptional regulator n=1 Tax=Cryobacterium adonitolivorans TaxID=1259189 RepID=A0A4R8WBX2_9MICO|nr:FCD domain-containing protein [Cryobacterium adonitolivorans]TFC05973.1 FadR family transcriptional regulator [Cryobacterium adonitolivorans]